MDLSRCRYRLAFQFVEVLAHAFSMINLLASILVLLPGLYLIGFAVVLLLLPARATRFLGGFASSAFTHYLELILSLIAGGAILLFAPHMLFSDFFVIFAWILVVTTVGLFAVSWRWHQRFAQWGFPTQLAI